MSKLNKQYFDTKEKHKKGFNKYSWIIWIGILLIFIYYVFNEIKQQLNKPDKLKFLKKENSYCIVDSEFQIGNIYYKDLKQNVIEKIGEPKDSIVDNEFNTIEWLYDSLSINFSRTHVYYISTNSEKYMTPSGLKVGLSKDEIFKILGKYPKDKYAIISKDKLEYQFVNCSYEIYMILIFDTNDYLKRLEIGIDLP